MLHIWISFQLSSSRSKPDVARRLHINPRRRWNSTAHSGIPCVFPSQRLTQRGRTSRNVTLLTFVIWCEGEEEGDNAHQQDNHQHHRCQEEGSARRPSEQPTQGLARTARRVAIPRGWAGEPDVQRADRPPTPSSHTCKRSSRERGYDCFSSCGG